MSKRGFLTVFIGLILLVGIGFSIYMGLNSDKPKGLLGKTVVHAVIGSEKKPYFNDPEVVKIFSKHGYEIDIETAGSRRIADPESTDLSKYDLAFPSSKPAAEKIKKDHKVLAEYSPFFSPMAVASFSTIAKILENQGTVSNIGTSDNPYYELDMKQYVELASSNKKWREISDEYPSPRSVLISSTNINTSNSAAMYLSILSWVANGENVVQNSQQVSHVIPEVAPLFSAQGWAEGSSSGPFMDYISQGIGARPLVMIYEAQFLGAQMNPSLREQLSSDMVLLSLNPTVTSSHVVLGLTDDGAEVARLLNEDEDLQRLAAKYGFRPKSSAVFEEVLSEHDIQAPNSLINSIETPTYEILEQLINGVVETYTSPPPIDNNDEYDS